MQGVNFNPLKDEHFSEENLESNAHIMTLPTEIILKILSQTKSLMCFHDIKLVSQRWKSIVDPCLKDIRIKSFFGSCDLTSSSWLKLAQRGNETLIVGQNEFFTKQEEITHLTHLKRLMIRKVDNEKVENAKIVQALSLNLMTSLKSLTHLQIKSIKATPELLLNLTSLRLKKLEINFGLMPPSAVISSFSKLQSLKIAFDYEDYTEQRLARTDIDTYSSILNQMTFLEKLHIEAYRTESLQIEFHRFTRLTNLFCGTFFKEDVLKPIEGLTQLEKLTLCEPNLFDGLSKLGKLVRLTILRDYWHSSAKSLDTTLVKLPISLRDLKHSQQSHIFLLYNFEELTRLKSLSVPDKFVGEWLINLTQLNALCIEGTKNFFSILDQNPQLALTSLTALELIDEEIHQNTWLNSQQFPNLCSLKISSKQVVYPHFLPNLERIMISCRDLCSFDGSLAFQTNLTELMLFSEEVVDFTQIRQLTNLKYLQTSNYKRVPFVEREYGIWYKLLSEEIEKVISPMTQLRLLELPWTSNHAVLTEKIANRDRHLRFFT